MKPVENKFSTIHCAYFKSLDAAKQVIALLLCTAGECQTHLALSMVFELLIEPSTD
jgi:hypothetical protein